MKETKLRVALYCSAGDQEAADYQMVQCRNSIRKHQDWVHGGSYCDVGKSGFENQDELQRLLADCDAGLIDLEFVRSMSRLARNVKTLRELLVGLKEKGISVVFEKECVNTMTEAGEIFLNVLADIVIQEAEEMEERQAAFKKFLLKDNTSPA